MAEWEAGDAALLVTAIPTGARCDTKCQVNQTVAGFAVVTYINASLSLSLTLSLIFSVFITDLCASRAVPLARARARPTY